MESKMMERWMEMHVDKREERNKSPQERERVESKEKTASQATTTTFTIKESDKREHKTVIYNSNGKGKKHTKQLNLVYFVCFRLATALAPPGCKHEFSVIFRCDPQE